jgi:group I intron endonuclease
MVYSIYLITNNINGKQYVGQTKNCPKKRFNQHKIDSRNKDTGCTLLWRAMRKHGQDCFSMTVLAHCDKRQVDDYETMFIELYDTMGRVRGYNILPGGQSGFTNDDLPGDYKMSGRPRKSTDTGIKYIYHFSKNGQEGYQVRLPDGSGKSFTSSKNTMEEKLEACKMFLEGTGIKLIPDRVDYELPKYITHTKLHKREHCCGYRVEFKLDNGKKHTRSFISTKMSMEQKLSLAKDYLSRCVFDKNIPVSPPAV